MDDERFMQQAIRLAAKGKGRVEPNPMVGAVIVADGEVVGSGYHRRFGGPHAEIEALSACNEKPAGATMYVTLEPCCHHGKTPPCTESLIESGISRVVVATPDPFPQVRGEGINRLRKAGIQVDVGICSREALELNAPYIKLVRTGLPFVILKWAQSVDGRTATAIGQSKWISSEPARRLVQRLRRSVDAIMVGINTVLHDDPLLTCRPARGRKPVRIVLDSSLRLTAKAKLVQTISESPVIAATINSALEQSAERAKELTEAGVEVLPLKEDNDRVCLKSLLEELGKRKMTNVLVEGGQETVTSFLSKGLADEVRIFIAPKIIGGDGLAAIGPLGISRIDHAMELGGAAFKPVGPDILLTCRLSSPEDLMKSDSQPANTDG
jgi:diaminohydroxyphosphoribosylaminopyrimidine deaminase/5-amino-6-(5-phosphoribosylamino)uracil reductase